MSTILYLSCYWFTGNTHLDWPLSFSNGGSLCVLKPNSPANNSFIFCRWALPSTGILNQQQLVNVSKSGEGRNGMGFHLMASLSDESVGKIGFCWAVSWSTVQMLLSEPDHLSWWCSEYLLFHSQKTCQLNSMQQASNHHSWIIHKSNKSNPIAKLLLTFSIIQDDCMSI